MTQVTVEQNVSPFMDTLIRKLGFRDPLKKSIDLLKGEASRNFDMQGAYYPGGGFFKPAGGHATTRAKPWKPLANSTKRQRAGLGYGAARPILERTGTLKRGFVTTSNHKEAEIKNTVKYAGVHQFGSKKRKIPARQILGTTKKSEDAILLIFANFIAKQISKINSTILRAVT